MRADVPHSPAHRREGGTGVRRRHTCGRKSPAQHRRPGAAQDTLGGKASRALGLSFGSTILNKISLFGIGVMLARLLGPHAFGTYAVAYLALVAVLTFNELGVSLAIVRWEGDPAEIAPTITTISLAVSVIIYISFFFATPYYTDAMKAPAATTVVRILALAVLSDAFTNTPAALLQRSFRQGKRTIADQVNVWLGTAVTVVLALTGFGAMSLAIGRLAGCVAGAVLLLWFAPGSLRLGFEPSKARSLLRFGLPLAGANIITFAVMNVDQVVVGHVLGTVALGYYALALNLAGWPITMFSQPLRAVGPAVFSRLQQDREAMRSTFMSAAGLLCAVALPVCLLIGGAAKPLISFVYGTRWVPADQPLIWLALLAAVQVFFLLAYDYLVVLVRSRFLLIIQLVWLLALIPALAAGAYTGGIYGAGLAEAAVAALAILPAYLGELNRVGIRLGALARHTWFPGVGAVLVGIVAIIVTKITPNDVAALASSGTAMIAVVGFLIYRMRRVLSSLRSSTADPCIGTPAAQAIGKALPDADAEDITGELAALWGLVDAPQNRYRDASQEPHPMRDASLSRTAYHDIAGPLQARYPGIPVYPPGPQDLSATSPLYWRTVASRRWDPADDSPALT